MQNGHFSLRHICIVVCILFVSVIVSVGTASENEYNWIMKIQNLLASLLGVSAEV